MEKNGYWGSFERLCKLRCIEANPCVVSPLIRKLESGRIARRLILKVVYLSLYCVTAFTLRVGEIIFFFGCDSRFYRYLPPFPPSFSRIFHPRPCARFLGYVSGQFSLNLFFIAKRHQYHLILRLLTLFNSRGSVFK